MENDQPGGVPRKRQKRSRSSDKNNKKSNDHEKHEESKHNECVLEINSLQAKRDRETNAPLGSARSELSLDMSLPYSFHAQWAETSAQMPSRDQALGVPRDPPSLEIYSNTASPTTQQRLQHACLQQQINEQIQIQLRRRDEIIAQLQQQAQLENFVAYLQSGTETALRMNHVFTSTAHNGLSPLPATHTGNTSHLPLRTLSRSFPSTATATNNVENSSGSRHETIGAILQQVQQSGGLTSFLHDSTQPASPVSLMHYQSSRQLQPTQMLQDAFGQTSIQFARVPSNVMEDAESRQGGSEDAGGSVIDSAPLNEWNESNAATSTFSSTSHRKTCNANRPHHMQNPNRSKDADLGQLAEPADQGETKVVPVSLPSDSQYLSHYQCYVRDQVCFFEATDNDIKRGAQGRNKPIVLKQV